MAEPQPMGGVQVLDAKSVDLCPWVEFYPEVLTDDEDISSYWLTTAMLIEAIHDFGVKNLESEFARIKVRDGSDLVALKFGEHTQDQWTRYATSGMFGVDIDPIIELGYKLDSLVDFEHNGEVVVYRSEGFHDLHIDGNKKRPISVRRCLLTLDGEKINTFGNPQTKQIVSSLTVPGSAVTISHGAIRHAARYEGENYAVYIQS